MVDTSTNADSADQALNLVETSIRFEGCTIEWVVSDQGCQFLDMYLYKDGNNHLQWRLWVKEGNHRERIPWVSHHPMDVKRSVYIGELFRLAVTCSNTENYVNAVRDHNALYLHRGYPAKAVETWAKNNVQERWDKCFAEHLDRNKSGVLVLKTRFNDVWSHFSATELGKEVTGYWLEWYDRFEQEPFVIEGTKPFPPYDLNEEHCFKDETIPAGYTMSGKDSFGGNVLHVPDLRSVGITGRRWLVSRKRNTNVLDLSRLWKTTYQEELTKTVALEGGVDLSSAEPNVMEAINPLEWDTQLREGPVIAQNDTDDIVLHRRSESLDQVDPFFGRTSKRTN
ncbi:hypothetical protein AX16_009808 [Volvariella volvacea WC 439]|nr:hypothetical protein AX16_009808 [Volvariella volvacea WC 439]